jgi:hypothetical protein
MLMQPISFLLSLLALEPGGLDNHIPGDYNWDNASDIVLQQDGTAFIKVWLTEQATCSGGYQATTEVSQPYGPEHRNWKLRAAADLGDGLPDFVFQNEDSNALVVWDMVDLIQVSGGFLDPSVPNQPLALSCSAYFNNDHQNDLGFQNTANGSVWVWVIDPANPRRRKGLARPITSSVAGFDPAGYRLAGCGDFTGDGFADLVLEPDNHKVLIAKVEGFTVTEVVEVAGPGRHRWNVGGVGDLDRDGHFELIWERNDAQMIEAWKMDYTDYQCTIPIVTSTTPMTWHVVGPR